MTDSRTGHQQLAELPGFSTNSLGQGTVRLVVLENELLLGWVDLHHRRAEADRDVVVCQSLCNFSPDAETETEW